MNMGRTIGFDAGNLIIGHRGAAGLAPENSLQGFRTAVRWGVDAVELDVHRVEGSLVVLHDTTLDRTTSGSGPLNTLSLAALRQLDAGAGQPIPLLEEVFAMLPAAVGVNIELKGRSTAALAADMALREHRKRGRDILLSSFDLEELGYAKRLLGARLRVAPLFHRWPKQGWRLAEGLGAWSVNLNEGIVSKRLIAAGQARGIKVLAYTVNDPDTASQLFGWGAAGVFTDRPDRLRSVRGR